MEKLEQRIIEIRENINFLDEKMNKIYSDYEFAKDKREDAEVNLEILYSQKKDIISRMVSKQISKVSMFLVPLNLILFIYLASKKITLSNGYYFNNIMLILSSLFLGCAIGYGISFIIVKILNSFFYSDKLFLLIDKEIIKLKSEEKKLNKKIKQTNNALSEFKSNEKEFAEMYSGLCNKYNSSKVLLDEVEGMYFDKTKEISSNLKTYNLYSLLNSLSEDDRKYIVDCIKTNFLDYTK